MDPKVCGRLLTTHRRGYGVDVETSMVDSPSGRTPATAPRWDLADTEGYSGGNISWVPLWMFSGYVGLYKRKNYIGGRPGGPRDRGVPYRGAALLSRACLGCFLTCTLSPLDHVRSKNRAPEGFIPFGLRLIFLFLETLK